MTVADILKKEAQLEVLQEVAKEYRHNRTVGNIIQSLTAEISEAKQRQKGGLR